MTFCSEAAHYSLHPIISHWNELYIFVPERTRWPNSLRDVDLHNLQKSGALWKTGVLCITRIFQSSRPCMAHMVMVVVWVQTVTRITTGGVTKGTTRVGTDGRCRQSAWLELDGGSNHSVYQWISNDFGKGWGCQIINEQAHALTTEQRLLLQWAR